jgi:hypothetical protein
MFLDFWGFFGIFGDFWGYCINFQKTLSDDLLVISLIDGHNINLELALTRTTQ